MLVTGNFIDDFKAGSDGRRRDMVRDEPLFADAVSPLARAMVAGMVEWLCNRHGLENEKPCWIFDQKYYLENPYFSLNAQGDLRYLYFIQSPLELRTRNIFTAYNFFERS